MPKSKRLYLLATLGMILSFPACGEKIYDTLDDDSAIINAVAYDSWTYVCFNPLKMTTVAEYAAGNTATPPADWHFAMHRYDGKTNGGAVLETGYTSLINLLSSGSMPEGEFVEDTQGEIMVDISEMMDENIVYETTGINTELRKWLDVDTASMPPVYTPSGKVYIIKMRDGTCAAVLLKSFISGKIAFEYIYPLAF